jgi:dolichol-phosphate mannosyltransferase
VHFVDRTVGQSKLGLGDLVEFGLNVWWLRLRSSATFGKFLAVGASGVVVNLGVFTALLNAGVDKFIASPIAIEASVVSNFLLNNYWTFRERKTKQRVRVKGLKFNAVSLLALALSYGTFVLLAHAFPSWPPQLHQFIGIVPATGVNYLLNSYWTFRREPPPK